MKGADEKLDVPEPVREIARRLEEAGYSTWAVGGAVRDALLLGRTRSDWDLATAAHPDVVRKLFRPSYPIGLRFGTVGVRASDGRVYEVTTFRKDIETDGRHAVVEYAEDIEEDLARRDFTINAIAYHPLEEEFRDPFAGREDLGKRVLRCVGEAPVRFAEDYLRVLRGLRFAGRYELEVEPATWTALTEAVSYLPRLSGERIREELLKVLAAEQASQTLWLYRDSGALDTILPELSAMAEDRWEEIFRTVDEIPPGRLELRAAALLAPIGEGRQEAMTRLRFSNAELRRVQELSEGLEHGLPAESDAAAVRRWLHEVGPEVARDVLRLRFARARGRGAESTERRELARRARAVLRALRRDEPVTLGDLAIDGNDLKALGLEPGPEFSRILDQCLEAVLEDPRRNRKETLLAMVRKGHGTADRGGT